MQGFWKSDISGYDKKGNRRKKNKSKYFIRDKSAAIMKKVEAKKHRHYSIPENVYREEPINISNKSFYSFLRYSHYVGFLYNRIFRWSDVRYDRGRRKAYAKKMVNGQTRASVRNWISKGDWDAERKTSCYEKSFAWYID